MLGLRAKRVAGRCNVNGELGSKVVTKLVNQAVFGVGTTCIGTCSLLVSCIGAVSNRGSSPIAHFVACHSDLGYLACCITARAVLGLRAKRVAGRCNVNGKLGSKIVAKLVNQLIFYVGASTVCTCSLLVSCVGTRSIGGSDPVAHLVAERIRYSISVGVLTLITGVRGVTVKETGGIDYGRNVIVTACIDDNALGRCLRGGISICKILCTRLAVPVFDITVLLAGVIYACKV